MPRQFDPVPRTDQPFLNQPQNFQFVIVGDRTGGHRPGVFEAALDRVNLLQPEFVVSVGDLIEGYTEDTDTLRSQWDEVGRMIDGLDMTFYRVPGNHDMGNAVMRSVWRQRFGPDYYHFEYKDVLFLVLNTEDPPVALPADIRARQAKLEEMMERDPVATQERILDSASKRPAPVRLPGSVAISEAQLEYFASVLAGSQGVRWTLVFMHKPAWLYGDKQFEKIEALLKDRPYTVVAGHEHYYQHAVRNGREYIVMGTTGGVWLRDGPGRLDHVAWVTMTDAGPTFAQIRIDAVFPNDQVPD